MAKAKKQAPVIKEQKIEPEVVVNETTEILNTPPVEEKEEDLSLQVFVQKDGEDEYKKTMEFNIPKDDKVMEAEHKERTEAIVDLTKEEKIVKFIENSTGKLVKLNDFLKSLYPALNHGEPPVWKQQITSRQIKWVILTIRDKQFKKQKRHHRDMVSFLLTLYRKKEALPVPQFLISF